MRKKLLMVGKFPPPIGGVTIHIQRLLKSLQALDYIDVDLLDYSRNKNIVDIFKKIYCADIIHLHMTNKVVRFVFVLLLRVFGKKVLVTFHGKTDFKDIFIRGVLIMTSFIIVLNEYSLTHAKKYKSKNIKLVGAFIPPIEKDIKDLDNDIILKLKELRENYKHIYCTNASNYVLDEKGNEIYMGTDLLELFKSHKDDCLIFSDPAGTYKKYFIEKKISISKNVFIIDRPHDFVNIIKQSHALIRATTMDGDSLSIKEALYYGVPVFASNIVDRPFDVILFENFRDLSIKIKNFRSTKNIYSVKDNSMEIVEVYRIMLKL